MARRSKSHKWEAHPNLLTSIRTPAEMLVKSDWNFERYESEVFARPCRADQMMYAAIDFCIAIVCLRDWTRIRFCKDLRAGDEHSVGPKTDNEADFHTFVKTRIPWQGAVESIARAAKHGTYNDDPWPEGIAMPASFVPPPLQEEKDNVKDGLGLFAFMHKHRDVVWWDVALRKAGETDATPGYVAFGDVLDGWHAVLDDWGYGSA